MFDTVCKFLVESFSTDFASWLLGEPVVLTELSPSELSLEPIRADALLLLQSPDTILHVEFQSRPDQAIPFRMVDYRLRTYRRFPNKAMRQVVIYLKPSQSPLVYQDTFEIPNTRHSFEIIRIWEQPVELFLSMPGLLPFAVLAKSEDSAANLRQAALRIEQLSDRRQQGTVAASAYVLAGLLLEEALIQQILGQDIMQDSVTYQAIKQEGREEGREEGRREASLSLAFRLLQHKFGQLSDAMELRISQLPVAKLESLGEAVLDFETVSDLSAWLEQSSGEE
ncbi:MAG: Rpn family recombination-promoting nuclease/putative transposase [Phormidesmis sp.]